MDYLFKAFRDAFGLIVGLDGEVYYVVWTSLKVSLAACLLAALIGVPLGMKIALARFRGRTCVLLLLNTLMALPTVVVGLFLYGLLGRRGPLGALEILYTPAGIILGEFILALPIVANLTVSAVKGLDPRLLLTCKSLGASPGQEARMILVEARYAVTAAIVAAFGRVIGEVGIAMMVGGNIKGFTRTMTTAIALETSKGEFELGLALGILLLLVALIVNVALQMLQRSKADD
ncbi:MAG: ABC transporter permease [Planctomycetes bacterium DG_58]|nr:MAG: ABC transporter permease [Planctomycetes bacterium DG_58]